jgi:hypothetical protein
MAVRKAAYYRRLAVAESARREEEIPEKKYRREGGVGVEVDLHAIVQIKSAT